MKNMKNTDNNGKLSKSQILAKLIYEAIKRYIKAKKSLKSERKLNFTLDSRRIWRGNVEDIDLQEKNYE